MFFLFFFGASTNQYLARGVVAPRMLFWRILDCNARLSTKEPPRVRMYAWVSHFSCKEHHRVSHRLQLFIGVLTRLCKKADRVVQKQLTIVFCRRNTKQTRNTLKFKCSLCVSPLCCSALSDYRTSLQLD